MDRDDLDSALACIPPRVSQLTGPIRFTAEPSLDDPDALSRWTQSDTGLLVELATEDIEPHDLAMEFLTCVGQALWERTEEEQRREWLCLLLDETDSGIGGELDEAALEAKQHLKTRPSNPDALEAYAAASFAASLAEYVHSLWHDIEFTEGEDFLPEAAVKRRFDLLSRWFPGFPQFADTGA